MHDPKFEKEVQRKMDELEFIPSGSVWANVQQTLAPSRRRRAIPLFWWFLVPGLLLLGAGGAVYLQSVGLLRGTTARNGAPVARPSMPAAARGERPAAAAGAPATIGAPAATEKKSTATGRESITIAGKPLDSGEKIATPSTRSSATNPASPLASNTPSASANMPRTPYNYRPGLIPSLTAYPGIKAPRPRSSSGIPSLAVTGLPRPKHPWAMGFAGGAGLSSFNESLLRPAAPVSASALSSTTNFTSLVVGNSGNSSKKYTSDIQPGISYWAGIFAEKPLSARWSLTLGLNLHYYSSRLETGEQVSTYAPVYASLISSVAVAPIQSYPYYSVGNQQVFTNRYYYLEIPAAVQWQITRSRTMPLFWRGGASLSRLMSSNALYYDDHSGVYFKDGAVINHTQLSLSTGVVAAISMKGVRIEAGPEAQYGVTGLLHSQAGNGHLLYGGIRLVVLPGK